MENKFSPNEILDKVLEWFDLRLKEMQHYGTTTDNVAIMETKLYSMIKEKIPELSKNEPLHYWGAIIDKLVIDKYLKKEPKYGNLFGDYYVYSITFEGIIFVSQKGYKGQKVMNDAENIRLEKIENEQRANQMAMTLLTVVLAVGTLPMFYFGLAELYWKYGWFQPVLSPFLATSLLIIGTIILIIIAFSVYLYPKMKMRFK